eukprot:gene16356-19459_t
MVNLQAIYRGTVTIGLLFLSCLFTVYYYMLPVILFVRPLSHKYYLYANNLIGDLWYRLIVFIFEVFNGVEIRFYGDDVPDSEGALLMLSHPSEVDWIFTWCLGLRKKSMSNIKIMLKNEIRYLPAIGWGCDNLDFIYLTRDWEFDESHIKQRLTKFQTAGFRPWLTIFPEGTDIDPVKLEKSHAFAEKNGFPKFNNVLLPRHKGVQACLEVMRPNLDAVYDITFGYESKPTILTCMLGQNPMVVNFYINRIPMSEVPTDEAKLQKWLFDLYQKKDHMLEFLKEHKKFPSSYTVPKTPALFWIFGVITPVFYYLFTSTYFRIYTLLATAFYIATSMSSQIRIFRGIDLPYKRRPKQKAN